MFAATLPGVSFRFLCCCIADEDLETDHIDAVKAFTQAGVDHRILVDMPEAPDPAEDGRRSAFCLLLLKALEGIKQGAFLWAGHNRKAWLKLGFVSWMNEPNLYLHVGLRIRVGVFADDTLVGYPKAVEEQYKAIKAEYSKLINIDSVSISPVLKFTGVQIERNRSQGTVTIHQYRYIEQLTEEYKGQFEKVDVPHGVSKEERHNFDNLKPAETKDLIDRGEYLKLLGKLVWPATMTRPDISFATNTLCGFVHSASRTHFQLGLNVVGYLAATPKLGITFGGRLQIPLGLSEMPESFEASCGLYIVHDSSWGTRARPMGGFVVMYMNGPIDWAANNLKIVPSSSHEAESAVAARAAKAGIFARELAKNNGRTVVGPTPALGDNKAHQTSVQQMGASARTRYYERAILLFKRAVLLLILNPLLVSTENMTADIFTKATDRNTFTKLRNAMMNVHGNLRQQLEASYVASTGRIRRNIGALFDTVTRHLGAETAATREKE